MSSDGKRSALSIWFLVSALVLPFLFTPQQLYRCQHQPFLQCHCSPDKRCWRANGVLSGTQTHILPPTARSRRYPASQKCKIVTETRYLTCFFYNRKCLTTIGCINSCMLDNYHKWDQVSKFHKTPIFPGCSLCLHLRDDPWLRKRGCSINWNPFNQSFCLPEVS